MTVPAVTLWALPPLGCFLCLVIAMRIVQIGILKNCFHCLFYSILKSLCAFVFFCFPDPLLFVCRHKKRGLSAFAAYECRN